MDHVTLHSIWTLLLFITFVGIVVWAWSSKRKDEFEEAANIPFHEEDTETQSPKSGDQ